jgi:short subunit dehydrogenase-like uncharacterized protein
MSDTKASRSAADDDGARLLVYGAYGYTGRLIVEAAAERGHEPIVAGRNRQKARGVASSLGLQARCFAVEDAAGHLGDVDAVLNCAGPFSETADALVDACIETDTHYLDITGELAVFERISRRDDAAADAGVTLLPGVGFDVVPTDCLAAHLHRRLPDATHLSLAIEADGGVSPGTLKTVLSDLGSGGAVRRDGRLRHEAVGARTRAVDFGDGFRRAVSIPWGDVSTAYHTTGIPNIDVYLSLPTNARRAVALSSSLNSVLDTDAVKRALTWLVDRSIEGPDEATRAEGEARVWGEARTDDERVVARLRTPETYELTVETALRCTEKVLAGDAAPGYETPAGAFGPDFVLEIPGVERVDLVDGEVVDRETAAGETAADETAAGE